ncbi:MAG: PIN domain-containing protein, partial [Proteobacteria bacterium]|nr:PIN domain-containing protein [Pseudomonadota bacterium]
IQAVDQWLAIPHVTPMNPGDGHWQTLGRLLLRAGTAGNLTNDAHLAAIAIDNACVICSADNDFKRFQGVQHFNPLADEDAVREPMLSY